MTPDEIDDNDALFGEEGLGLDSVDSIELVLAIEKEYAVKITDSKQYEILQTRSQEREYRRCRRS